MQKEIDDRLARAILAGDVRDGDAVRVDVAADGDGLELSSEGSAPFTVGLGDAGVTGGPDDVIEAELLDE